jgi:hypothetical protein
MQRRSRRPHGRLRELTALSALVAALVVTSASAAPSQSAMRVGDAVETTNDLADTRHMAIADTPVEQQKRVVDHYGEIGEDVETSDVVPLELDHEVVDGNAICQRVDPPVTKTGTRYRC